MFESREYLRKRDSGYLLSLCRCVCRAVPFASGSLHTPALLVDDRKRQTFYNGCMDKYEGKTESGRSRWMALTALVLVIAIVVVYVLSW